MNSKLLAKLARERLRIPSDSSDSMKIEPTNLKRIIDKLTD